MHRFASSPSYLSSSPINQRWLAAVLTACVVIACDSNPVTVAGPEVSVCHLTGAAWVAMDIDLSELPEHKSHGDYVTRLEVDKLATVGDSIHFARVTDALNFARAGRIARDETQRAACRITIQVAPGSFAGSTTAASDPALERFPLLVNVPDITLKGSFKMQVDASGRATGVGEGDVATTFTPSPALSGGGTGGTATEPIIAVDGQTDGSKGHGAVIEGFVFQSGRAATDTTVGGIAVLSLRVRDLVVRDSRFESGMSSALDLRASSGLVERIHFSGRGSSCDICLAGPGDYIVKDNRLIGGGIPGVLILPAVLLSVPSAVQQYTLPAASTVTALIMNNEVRGHVRRPVGVGLRIGAVGVGASSVAGTSKATFTGNSLVGNTFGIIVEGAFLNQTDATRRRGDIELVTSGNTISGSCQTDLLVTLSNSQTGLGIATGAYLVNSTYTLRFGADIQFDNAWYANAAGTGNTLMVNGQAVASGSRHAYDAARTCP
jgi:hypothetical protein